VYVTFLNMPDPGLDVNGSVLSTAGVDEAEGGCTSTEVTGGDDEEE
jgi:hypothetical protein